jgi:FkbM family methyltransferase
MPVQRWVRRQAASWLPPWIKAWIKAPYRAQRVGFRAAETSVSAMFSADDQGPLVTIDRRVRLRFRDEDRDDVAFLLRDNGESVEEMASFLGVASPARLLFDIGAAKGVFSDIFCLLHPASRAVAFEPSPGLADSAAALAVLNGCQSRFHLRRCAVGAKAGRHTARLYPWGYVGVDDTEGEGVSVQVDVTSIDQEVEQLGMEPDLMKIDVEGYEYEVLLGAKRLLERRKPPICLELHLDLLERRGIKPRRVLAELESHGYQFRSCAGRSLRAAEIAGSLNAIFRFVAT